MIVLGLALCVVTFASAIIVRHLTQRIDELTAETVLRPFVLDLDAVREAGDRAELAVRDAQAIRVPRRERNRHLAVVA